MATPREQLESEFGPRRQALIAEFGPPPNYNQPTQSERLAAEIAATPDRSGDALNELGTFALETAGSALIPAAAGLRFAPRVLSAGAAAPGAGALRSFLQMLKGASYGAAGEVAGNEVAQEIGIAPETTGSQNLKQFLASTAIGTTFGEGAELYNRGLNRVPYDKAASLADPAVREAVDLADRRGALPSDPLDKKVKASNLRAQSLDREAAAELGANAGQTPEEVALGDTTRQKMPELLRTTAFEGADAEQAGFWAKQELESINRARADRVAELGGSVRVTSQDLTDTVQAIQGRIAELRKHHDTVSIANAMDTTLRSTLRDINMRPGGATAEDVVDIMQDANLARRVKGQDFNLGVRSANIKGDAPSTGDLEASREVMQQLNDGLAKSLDAKTGDTFFSETNRRYGNAKALEQQTKKFERDIARGSAERSEAGLVKTPSQQGATPIEFAAEAAAGNKANALVKLLKNMFGAAPETSPGLQSVIRNQEKGGNAVANIRALRALNQRPATLTPQSPQMLNNIGGAPQAGIIGANTAQLGMNQAQAQEPQPFARSTEAIMQNPQGFIETVKAVTGGPAQLMADIAGVFNEPNETKRESALAELAKMIPQAFTPSPWRSLWDGRISDPEEQAMFADDLKTKWRRGELDANQYAKGYSAMNMDGSVVDLAPAPPAKDPNQGSGFPAQGPRGYSY